MLLLIETLCNFRAIKCWFILYLQSCVSHSIDICTVAIKNIRNMHAGSTNQIADILHYNDKFL